MGKFFVTTSIAYVNAEPHIGFAFESLQADVLARYRKAKGDEVFFLTGTDEHGIKIYRSALAAGIPVEKFVDANADKFCDLRSALNLSWDNFIRTSDKKIHWPVATEIWSRLVKSGDLYKKSYRGLYCVGHEAFVTQKDLVDGKCADHKKEPEIIEEENWFFRLSKYSAQIEKLIESGELKIVPESRRNEILSLLRESPEDVSFSRPVKTLPWGVPVPGDDSQTMYVWVDALSNYISGYGGIAKWQDHPADVHCIGKDILRFHAMIWPAMLISAGLKLPKSLFVHGHILSGGEKMSKSLGNVVNPFELVDKYGIDPVRYFLLREIPSLQDGDFSFEKFKERYNGDLANGLGNLVARVFTLAAKEGELSGDLMKSGWGDAAAGVEDKIVNFELDKALVLIWLLIHAADSQITVYQPWKKDLAPQDRQKYLLELVGRIYEIAVLAAPFLPDTSDKILSAIEIDAGKVRVKRIVNLFARIGK